MDNKRASNIPPKIWIYIFNIYGRGAFQRRRSCNVSYGGVSGKANVGISNDKAGKKPAHRKTKVS